MNSSNIYAALQQINVCISLMCVSGAVAASYRSPSHTLQYYSALHAYYDSHQSSAGIISHLQDAQCRISAHWQQMLSTSMILFMPCRRLRCVRVFGHQQKRIRGQHPLRTFLQIPTCPITYWCWINKRLLHDHRNMTRRMYELLCFGQTLLTIIHSVSDRQHLTYSKLPRLVMYCIYQIWWNSSGAPCCCWKDVVHL
jgi:hypothetical protein